MSEACQPKSVRIFAIQRPIADQAVLMANYNVGMMKGEMEVEIRAEVAGVRRVIAQAYADAAADPMPPVNPNGPLGDAVEIPRVGQSDVFRLGNFVVNNLTPDGPFSANKKLIYWGYDGSDVKIEDGAAIRFAAVPNPCTATVSAKHCLWLTYAAPGSTLSTFHETTGDGSPYYPAGVRVPATAAQARVEVLSGAWRHDPNPATETGAEGRAGTASDLDPRFEGEYRNAGGQMLPITGTALNLNRLVALLEHVIPTTPTTEIDAATNTAFSVAGAHRLRLGMHDSFEWSNNQGSLNVRITWS